MSGNRKRLNQISDLYVWKEFSEKTDRKSFLDVCVKIGFSRTLHRGVGIIQVRNSSRIYLESIKVSVRALSAGISIPGDQDWVVDSLNGKMARSVTFWFEVASDQEIALKIDVESDGTGQYLALDEST